MQRSGFDADSAGCVLSARLTENPKVTLCVIEKSSDIIAKALANEWRWRADGPPGGHHFACAAGTLISCGRMIAATITSRHSAPNACSMVEKPPRS
jgi:choline dehydrogenase-like flavoprotein